MDINYANMLVGRLAEHGITATAKRRPYQMACELWIADVLMANEEKIAVLVSHGLQPYDEYYTTDYNHPQGVVCYVPNYIDMKSGEVLGYRRAEWLIDNGYHCIDSEVAGCPIGLVK